MLLRINLALLSVSLAATAQMPDEKKFSKGPIEYEGRIVDLEGSFEGTKVPVGTRIVFLPEYYTLEVNKAGDPNVYRCRVGKLPPSTSTGDVVKVAGKLSEIRKKTTNALSHLQIDSCKIQSRRETEESQDRSFSGVITSKSERTGLLASITVSFQSRDGKKYSCMNFLGGSIDNPTLADAIMNRQKIDTFERYKVGDSVLVSGYPSLLENLSEIPLGLCEIQSYTQTQ